MTARSTRPAGPVSRVPLSQLAIRAPRLDHFEDPAAVISERRIRRHGDGIELDEDRLAMCTIVRSDAGGPLRAFNGGRAHENGWHSSWKAQRLLHWQGETALMHLLKADTDHDVVRINAESVEFEMPALGPRVSYRADAELTDATGRTIIVEVKRTERDLDDPKYRLKLAYVREVCRRCDMGFRIVFQEDLFESIVHRRNVSLFASRGFVRIEHHHRRILGDRRRSSGLQTTYGVLAEALEPGHPAAGRAVVQGMLVRRLVKMDLTSHLDDASTVTIV